MTQKVTIDISEVAESESGSWSVQQRHAAHWLAIGADKRYTAAQVGMQERQLFRWLSNPAYVAYVEELHQATWERVEPKIMANVMLALDLQRQVLTGEVPWNDKRLGLADKLMTRILDRLLFVEPAPAAGGQTANGTVNVLVGGGG